MGLEAWPLGVGPGAEPCVKSGGAAAPPTPLVPTPMIKGVSIWATMKIKQSAASLRPTLGGKVGLATPPDS